MESRIGTFVVAATASLLLVADPAAAQHRRGGQSGGGRGGGPTLGAAAHARADIRTGGHSRSGRTVVGVAVPRVGVVRPRIDQHTTVVLPSYRRGVRVGALGAYGYSPYGYSPYAYGSPGASYYGGYGSSAHARVRILDAPRQAEVFVDGYYAGIVNDFDGVFQHLELTPGPHQIEIRAPGFQAIVFDVNAIPGRTISYRALMTPLRP